MPLYVGHTKYKTLGQIPMQQQKYGWTEVGGDFLAPDGKQQITLLFNDQFCSFVIPYCVRSYLPCVFLA
jgi:hypothetical protein